MGYMAYISGSMLRITDTEKAHEILIKEGLGGSSFEDCLHTNMFEEVLLDAQGNVDALHFNSKYRDEDAIFQALAPVIAPDTRYPDTIPFVEWVGEDDYRWRFVFIDGKMQEVDARIEWPYLNEQRTNDITVQPLTIDGTSGKSLLLSVIEDHIAYLEALQRNGREWYEERYRYEGSKYPPYPNDIEQLIREEKMTWKAVKDASRVILNIEAIDE